MPQGSEAKIVPVGKGTPLRVAIICSAKKATGNTLLLITTAAGHTPTIVALSLRR